MSNAREIRNKIKGINNVCKITNAMQMVAASKIKKVRSQMESTRPYFKKIREVIANLAKSNTEYKNHKYLSESKNSVNDGLMIMSTDKGLCGSLNYNLFRFSANWIKSRTQNNGSVVKTCLIGDKSIHFYAGIKQVDIKARVRSVGETPKIEKIIGAIKIMLDLYKNDEIKSLYVLYNQYVTSMVQKPFLLQILPITIDEFKVDLTKPSHEESDDNKAIKDKKSALYGKNVEDSGVARGSWDYIYEPDSIEILDLLLHRYVESQIYQALVENIACEQVARMIAMQNATDNAKEFMFDMELSYNKARQNSITSELAEIVGGSSFE